MNPLRRIARRRVFLLALAALISGILVLSMAARPAAAESPLPRASLIINTATGRHVFQVEIAATPQSRARGLMFRRHLARGAGMLFDFGPGEHPVTMWMKNTPLPLDMIFIAGDGKVQSIAEDTVPYSLALIPSRGRVRAVLEVAAGTVRRLRIAAGDIVSGRLFGR